MSRINLSKLASDSLASSAAGLPSMMRKLSSLISGAATSMLTRSVMSFRHSPRRFTFGSSHLTSMLADITSSAIKRSLLCAFTTFPNSTCKASTTRMRFLGYRSPLHRSTVFLSACTSSLSQYSGSRPRSIACAWRSSKRSRYPMQSRRRNQATQRTAGRSDV
jgi:hypothetical protein